MCARSSEMKNLRKSLRCVCVAQWPWDELQLINSVDDVALAVLFFCSQHRAANPRVSSPIPKEGKAGRGGGGGGRLYKGGSAVYHTASLLFPFFCPCDSFTDVHVIDRPKIQFNDGPPCTKYDF